MITLLFIRIVIMIVVLTKIPYFLVFIRSQSSEKQITILTKAQVFSLYWDCDNYHSPNALIVN